MEWFADNSWLAWIGIALVCAAVEAASADLFFLMLAGGAVVGALTALLGGSVPVQVVMAVLAALVLVLTVRPLARRRLTVAADTSIGVQGYIGRAALVTEQVTSTGGLVKLGGETWSARTEAGAPAIPPGHEVRVLSIEGATAVVTDAAAGREVL